MAKQKYSIEWKIEQTDKYNGWPQYHPETQDWKWHSIEHDTEYRRGSYLTKADCITDRRRVVRYYIEFLNPSTNSWLGAGCDFEGCSAGFATQKAAREWIADTRSDECFKSISFKILEGAE